MNDVTAKTGYHHGDLRQQLIAATRALVEARGPDGFSVAEASRAAGVSTAAPYKHFADRTEILQAVAMQGYHEMTAAFRASVADCEPGSPEAIAAIGTAYVTFAETHPELFRMMFAFKDKTPDMVAAGDACYAVVLEQIALWMGRAEVDEDVMKVGLPLWIFVHGLSFLRIDGKFDASEGGPSVADLVRGAGERFLVRP